LISLFFTVGAMGESALGGGKDAGLLFLGLIAICLPVALLGVGAAIFVSASWSMVIPAIVGEGVDGTASLGRSNTLVKGERLRIIGRLLLFEAMRLFVLTLPILAIELFVIGGTFVASTTSGPSFLSIVAIIAASIFSSIENVLVVPFYIIYITVNYLDLRVRKENLDLQIKAANLAPADTAGLGDSGARAVATASIAQIIVSSPVPDIPSLAVITQPPAPQEMAGNDSAAPSDNVKTISTPTFDSTLAPAQRISVLFKRLRIEGQSPEVLNELGLAYQEVGDLFGARDSFTRARTLAPDNPDYAYNMASLQRQRRDMPSARQAMADYLRLEKNADKRQKVLDNPALRDILA
jgi:hypothetical protein